MTYFGHKVAIKCCFLSYNNLHLFSGARNGTLKCFNSLTGKEIYTFHDAHFDGVESCILTKDDNFLISASDDYTLKSWNLRVSREITTK